MDRDAEALYIRYCRHEWGPTLTPRRWSYEDANASHHAPGAFLSCRRCGVEIWRPR